MNVMNFVYGFLVLVGVFIFQTTLTGLNRKVTARLQKRYGARWYQQFLDIFKEIWRINKDTLERGCISSL